MKEKIIENIWHIGIFFGILFIAYLIAHFAKKVFKKLIANSTDVLNNDPTNYQFLQHFVTAIIYLTGIAFAIYTIPSLRAIASSMLAGAGILAVAVGFASQHALSNVISGVFIVLFKPFRINDRLKLREMDGIVEDITLRHTVIRNFENRRIIIPNSIISEEVIINSDFGDDRICKWIDISISYESNIELAKKIIKEEIIKHPNHIDFRTEKERENGIELAMVRVVALADSSINLRGWAWTKNSADAFALACDLNESIKNRFDKEGISIPYPHSTVILKKEGN